MEKNKTRKQSSVGKGLDPFRNTFMAERRKTVPYNQHPLC